jgi:hypothetical protein
MPIGMSMPLPSRVSNAESPACNTMNRLARLARASETRPWCSSADSVKLTLSPRWLATAGRARSLGSSI